MAKLSSNGKYVTVEKGDTLSEISQKYYKGGTKKYYEKLAQINGIVNPNYIVVGQKIYLSKTAAGSSSGSSKKVTNEPVVKEFGLLAYSNNKLFATWSWCKEGKQTAGYKVEWGYQTIEGVWFVGEKTDTITNKYHMYDIPDNAVSVRFRVTAVANTRPVSVTNKTKNNSTLGKVGDAIGVDTSTTTTTTKEEPYFKEDWTAWKTYKKALTPVTNPSGTVKAEIDNTTLSFAITGLTYTTLEANSIEIKIERVKELQNGKSEKSIYKSSVKLPIKYAFSGAQGEVSYTCTVSVGYSYNVYYRAVKVKGKTTYYSDWVGPAEAGITKPPAVKKINKLTARNVDEDEGTGTVRIEWDKVSTATSYDIEYTTDKQSFDKGDTNAVHTESRNSSPAEISDIPAGKEYFFRLRAVNEKGESKWTDIKSVIIAIKPDKPDVWSTAATAIVGEHLDLYFTHNTTDGSKWTKYKIRLYGEDGSIIREETIENTLNVDDTVIEYSLNTSDDDIKDSISEGATIKWIVSTLGLSSQWSDWSDFGEIKVYAKPTVGVSVLNQNGEFDHTIRSFPFTIVALPAPDTQVPLSYHVQIRAKEGYDTVDTTGFARSVAAEDIIYSKYFDITTEEKYCKVWDTENGYVTHGEVLDVISVTKLEDVYTINGEQVYECEMSNELKCYCCILTTDLYLQLSASDIDLENDIQYDIEVTASMDSGLIAESVIDIDVAWGQERSVPSAEVIVDTNNAIAYIRPYCSEYRTAYYKVTRSYNKYIATTEVIYGEQCNKILDTINGYIAYDEPIEVQQGVKLDDTYASNGEPVYKGVTTSGTECYYWISIVENNIWGSELEGVYTTTGEQVFSGFIGDDSDNEENDTEIYYYEVPISELTTDVILSVYRRETDGTFTEIETGLENKAGSYVTDPHPALDYARYRIVATSTRTGAVSFYDVPGVPVREPSIVIQWDESWFNPDTFDSEDLLAEMPWSGSMVKLPYNVDVSEKTSPEVALVSYIGREHPVSYYGTQKNVNASWNAEIEKSNTDLIHALRQLAIWSGDVYVREPSGVGYWANVNVSFSQKHCELTIPVSLDIIRVEGGV